jgi:prepilin-type N-terminal cleavage/methylation domain-containing protein/prepilin-type processing-associated H-X9-DG protein
MSIQSPRRKGFTLVELLVVIGIIALLISILMPALSRARDQANMIKCMSNMRQIGQAYMMHAGEHRNHVPTAGLMFLPYTPTPQGMTDSAKVKYMYFSDGGIERPLPMPAALGLYLNQKIVANSAQQLYEEMKSGPVREVFTCPTQPPDSLPEGVMLASQDGWEAPRFASSYIFNEEPLGFNDVEGEPNGYKRGRGNLNRMRGTSDTMMLMEGKVRDGYPWLVIYAVKANTVLEDAFFGILAGDRSNFEFARHRGKINMVFMDGHAETITATCRPNYEFPQDVKFSRKVYTVPENGF